MRLATLRLRLFACIAATAVFGCAGEEESSDTAASSGTESPASTDGETAQTSTTSGGADPSATSEAPQTTGSNDSDEGSTSGAPETSATSQTSDPGGESSSGPDIGGEESGTTDPADACEPPGDDCGDCMATHCCDQITECLTDVDCSCFQMCAAANPDDVLSCANPDQCNIPLTSLLDPNTVVGRMSTCTQTNCVQCL